MPSGLMWRRSRVLGQDRQRWWLKRLKAVCRKQKVPQRKQSGTLAASDFKRARRSVLCMCCGSGLHTSERCPNKNRSCSVCGKAGYLHEDYYCFIVRLPPNKDGQGKAQGPGLS